MEADKAVNRRSLWEEWQLEILSYLNAFLVTYLYLMMTLRSEHVAYYKDKISP